eukprot:Phypoly_transcript_02087.p1 GENE.Phypoly_transcript_02087~~Phypoly_transcript_02087.p1  ORF type:complete len:597 (+),score=133.78 Phypoly_transcript_02087:1029-2819(+)
MLTMERSAPHSPHSPHSPHIHPHPSHTTHGEGVGYTTSAKQKLDELFVTWLSFSDTSSFISSIISSFKLSPASPSSPVDSPTITHDGTTPSSSFASSPRKYSPRKYNRAYARTGADDHAPPVTPSSPKASPTFSPPLDTHHTQHHTPHHTLHLSPQPKHKPTDSYATIPRFFFPKDEHTLYPPLIEDEIGIAKISSGFASSRVLPFQEALVVLCGAVPGLPVLVCRYILQKEGESKFDEATLLKLWRQYISGRDAASAIFEMLRQGQATTLQPADFRPFVRVILDSHPGLSFLGNTPEFQERYLETILVRIFYNCPRGITGKMDLGQLRKSGLVAALTFIDNEADINKSLDYFSYEHFYVIYCKFWEVDTDHDLIISADDLMRYSGGPPTRRVAERVAATPAFPRDPDLARVLASKQRRQNQRGAPRRSIHAAPSHAGLMTYQDFVWFILSEEDRDSPAALEYWFRMLDLDEDGVWSSFELEYFYSDMQPYLRDLGMDPPPFEDLLCQWLDMLSPEHALRTTAWDCPQVRISAKDLRKSKLGKAIIHSLVSPSKFVALETKDPFSEPRDGVSDWMRFALIEYELAVADQQGLRDDD